MARRKPKRPKQPKRSASLETWRRWDERMKNWKKKCNEIDAPRKAKEAIRKKYL